MEEGQQEFDVRVMLESFKKAIEVREVIKSTLKLDLKPAEVKDIAVTFFIQSMKNIAESRKKKEQSQYANY